MLPEIYLAFKSNYVIRNEKFIFVLSILLVSFLFFLPSQSEAVTWGSANKVDTDNTANQDEHEPFIVTSATNPNTVLTGAIQTTDSFGDQKCKRYVSTNGGTTWTSAGFLNQQSNADQVVDVSMASDSNGNLYISCLEFAGAYGQNTAGRNHWILFSKSTNGGSSWSDLTPIDSGDQNLIDKPKMTIDRNNNNIYFCYEDFTNGQIRFARSSDNYIPYTVINSDAGALTSQYVASCNITIGPSDQVYVVYQDPFSNTIKIIRSLSNGAQGSWTAPVTIGNYAELSPVSGCDPTKVPDGCLTGYKGVIFEAGNDPTIATDSNGGVHVAWATQNNYQSTSADISYAYSNSCKSSQDACSGWTVLPIVNNDGTNTDQWDPAITVSSTNVVHISVYDRRDDSNNVAYKPYDYSCPVSSNCASSNGVWTEIPISSRQSSNYDQKFFIDDYHAITTSTQTEAYSTWTDRSSNALNYDIYSSNTGGAGGCTPPPSGPWDITSSCTLSTTSTVLGSITVESTGSLTVNSGVTLHIDLSSYKILIQPGGKVFIQSGGMITK